MKTLFIRLLEQLSRAWQRRETQRQLSQLDERMLKDIGLESWKNPEGARLWAHRVGLY